MIEREKQGKKRSFNSGILCSLLVVGFIVWPCRLYESDVQSVTLLQGVFQRESFGSAWIAAGSAVPRMGH
jgi:hypothetical protein